MSPSQEVPSTGAPQICQIPWKVDGRVLEEDLIVRWDENKQGWVRWKGLYFQEKGGTTFWQNHHPCSQTWRKEKSYGMWMYGVGVLTEAQGIMNAENNVKFWMRKWWKVGDAGGQEDISVGQWSQKHIQEGKKMIWRQWHWCHDLIRPLPWSKHCWVDLKKGLKMYPTPHKRVVEEWDKILPEVCKNLKKASPEGYKQLSSQKAAISSISCVDSDSRRLGQKTVPMSHHFV